VDGEVAPLVGDEALTRPPLLLYLSNARDRQRIAVAPALAAAAERSGWGFECYYDDLRKGRHFGGGDPASAPSGWAAGSLVSGGRHADQLLWLATGFQLVALGDPGSLLWPTVEAAGGEILARSLDPAELYRAAFGRLGQRLSPHVLVLDAAPQGRERLVVAPYLYPAFFAGASVLGLEVSSDGPTRSRLEALGATEFRGLYVEAGRAAAFPGGLDANDGQVGAETYASLTAALAERHADWGRGILIGDPELVVAQLPRARRLRLLPLYGRPQTEAIERSDELIRNAQEPVFGRQYDDRDFFSLARAGHGLQVLDPGPPFDSAGVLGSGVPAPPEPLWDAEPDDEQLRRWAAEGRVLVTLLLWSGMVRELDCIPRLVDLVAATGLRAGLVVTRQTLEYAAGSPLSLLAVPPDRGGVFGLLELLLGCTGEGVAAEALMPPNSLADALERARAGSAERLPEGLVPRGWWPLLDAPLVPRRAPRVGWRSHRPVIRFTPRGPVRPDNGASTFDRPRDLRTRVGAAVRGSKLEAFFEARRPFDDMKPGAIDQGIAEAVRAAGFSYMWSKAAFGAPSVLLRRGDFVALSLTAGNWDGWSPFYTLSGVRDLVRAERRLLRAGRPGWLAGTIDSPLWTLPGEFLERGVDLFRIAELAAAGGKSGSLVNVTPHVVARYARLLHERTGGTDGG
jgi:hypothetical protein